MKTLEAIQEIKIKYPHTILKEIECCDQYTLEVRKENLMEVLFFLKQTPSPGYEVLMDLTGVDYLEPVSGTQIVYWLHNPTNFQRIRLILFAMREEKIPSVTHLWKVQTGMSASCLTYSGFILKGIQI